MLNEISLAQELIKFKTITPKDDGIVDYLISILDPIGFKCEKYIFNNTINLFAKYGNAGKNFAFSGHTDVVPTGNLDKWSHDPFGAKIENGYFIGRGAADMKGAIAASITAISEFLYKNQDFNETISIIITADEETSSENGMIPLMQDLHKKNIIPDVCLIGEPTNPTYLGEMVKIGRRGSINFEIKVTGVQGHVAYPHLASNPNKILVQILNELINLKLDEGNENFDPSNLEITSIDVMNQATNVIPETATARFNIRYNDIYTRELLEKILNDICSKYSSNFAIDIISNSESFICKNEYLVNLISESIKNITGHYPLLSTSGGTSDARFIKDYCPTIEFGLINKTAHKIDEKVRVEDITTLKSIYIEILKNYFI